MMAYTFFVSMTGTKTGKFVGDTSFMQGPRVGPGPGADLPERREVGLRPKDEITGLGFAYEVDALLDPQSGNPRGLRQHRPIRFIKAWGVSTPQIFNALVQNEVLTQVTFRFFKPGDVNPYFEIKLKDALVTGLRQFSGLPWAGGPAQSGDGSGELEEVSLQFEYIQLTFCANGVTAGDAWTQRI
jgi:type VI secretion system Hcp family effector